MRWLIFLLLLGATTAQAGLERYRDLVVADGEPASALHRGEVRVTYLGTNAYLLESRTATILVDPYFSRVGLGTAIINGPARSRPATIRRFLPARKIDAVLVTHGHIDHLLDAPEVMRQTGAKLIASPTSVKLVEATGLPARRCVAVNGGEKLVLRGAVIRVFAAGHDRIFGRVLFDGPPRRLPARKVGDWVCGTPLAFLIELEGQRIYIESGGRPDGSVAKVGPIDLAILGVALPDARKRFPKVLRQLRPRFVLPSHQDNFFRPLARGFVFGMMTDFPDVLKTWGVHGAGSRLILLDYFRPWTLR